jgi:hypothetical protein
VLALIAVAIAALSAILLRRGSKAGAAPAHVSSS